MSGETSTSIQTMQLVPARRSTVLSENTEQRDMANTAKDLNAVALEAGCFAVNQTLKTAIAGEQSIPEPIGRIAVDACTRKTQTIIQGKIDEIIDSNYCYGNEDSCISKTTKCVKHLIR